MKADEIDIPPHNVTQESLDKLYELKRQFVFDNKEFFESAFKEMDKLLDEEVKND